MPRRRIGKVLSGILERRNRKLGNRSPGDTEVYLTSHVERDIIAANGGRRTTNETPLNALPALTE